MVAEHRSSRVCPTAQFTSDVTHASPVPNTAQQHRVARYSGESPSCGDGSPGWSGDFLPAAHSLLDQPHDHHQDASADPAGDDLADNRTDIEAACSGRGGSGSRAAAQERPDDLCSHAPADHAGDRVADSPEVVLLQRRASNVAAHAAGDQLNDQTDDSAPHVKLPPLARLPARLSGALHALATG